MTNLKNYYWVLRNEPKRLWAWWHRHSPITGKRYSLKEAFRAVWENPPCFDISWDEDMEKKPCHYLIGLTPEATRSLRGHCEPCSKPLSKKKGKE